MSKEFIPEPGRWALVAVDWYAVFDVLGWLYDPDTDSSQPVVSSRKHQMACAHDTSNGFYVLVPQWTGMEFGHGDVYRVRDTAPKAVRNAVDRQHNVWAKNVIAETDAEAAEIDCGCDTKSQPHAHQ